MTIKTNTLSVSHTPTGDIVVDAAAHTESPVQVRVSLNWPGGGRGDALTVDAQPDANPFSPAFGRFRAVISKTQIESRGLCANSIVATSHAYQESASQPEYAEHAAGAVKPRTYAPQTDMYMSTYKQRLTAQLKVGQLDLALTHAARPNYLEGGAHILDGVRFVPENPQAHDKVFLYVYPDISTRTGKAKPRPEETTMIPLERQQDGSYAASTGAAFMNVSRNISLEYPTLYRRLDGLHAHVEFGSDEAMTSEGCYIAVPQPPVEQE